MANAQLMNDKVYGIPVPFTNSGGTAVTAPSGATVSAVSSVPASLGVAVGGSASAPVLYLTPKVQASTGISVTVSAPGCQPATTVFDIVADPNAVYLAIDFAHATTTAQNVPTAPGP